MRATPVLVCSTLLSFLPGILNAEKLQTVFLEEFDRYGSEMKDFNPGSNIWEAPPSLKTFVFSPEKYSLIRKDHYWIPAHLRSVNTELHFSFQFSDITRKKLDLHFQMTAGDQVKDYILEIRDDGSSLKASKGSKVSGLNKISRQNSVIPPFIPNRMHNAILKIYGKHVEFFVERDGKMVRECSADTDNGMLSAFNFASDCPFQLDHIKVRSQISNTVFPQAYDMNEAAKDTVISAGWEIPAIYTANEHTDIIIPVHKKDDVVSFELTVNSYPGDFAISMGTGKEKKSVTFKSIAQTADHQIQNVVDEIQDGKRIKKTVLASEKVLLPDYGYSITGAVGVKRLCTRPTLQYRYEPDGLARVIGNWENYPAASETPIYFELRKNISESNWQLWANGSYIAAFPMSENGDRDLVVNVPAGAVVKKSAASTSWSDSLYMPLDLTKYQNNGKGYAIKLAGMMDKITGSAASPSVPGILDGPVKRIDTGLCEENLGSYYLECDGFLETEALDGMPGRFIFQVPTAQYVKAWLYCAVDPHPDKEPVVTARLTEVSGQGRSQARCDATVELPEPGRKIKDNEKVKQVGTVTLANGKEVPLYQVECCFDIGSIQDLVFDLNLSCLNFEVLGNLYDKDSFYLDKSMKPSEEEKSSVQVFAVTLEKSPVNFRVKQNRTSNVYYPDEKAGISVLLDAVQDGTYTLQTTVKSFKGEILEQYKDNIKLKKNEFREIRIDFNTKEYGWYPVYLELQDKDGKTLIRQEAAFTQIAADTRKATVKESPYFIWNFNGAHGTVRDINIWGDILKRMGVRKTLLPKNYDRDKWHFTLGQYPHINITGATEEEREAFAKATIERLCREHPDCNTALIFHESGNGPFPMELIGEEMPDDPGGKKTFDRAYELAKYWRKYAPHVKLQIGNTGNSLGGLARLFRNDFPAEYIDYMGEESVGMTMVPEHSTSYFFWALQDLARTFGYDKVRPNPCFEWRSRVDRHQEGDIKQSETVVRDALIAHVWECELIPLVGISEVANSYYNTIWAGGSFSRYPLLNPGPSFTATSVMTQIMDQVRFSRLIPTGSATVYAAEFKRGNEYVYALWTADGEQSAKIKFRKKTRGILTEIFGKETVVGDLPDNQLDVILSESPIYLTLDSDIQQIDLHGKRCFKENDSIWEQVSPNDLSIVKLDDKDQWNVIPGKDDRLEFKHAPDPIAIGLRCAGNYELQNVNDSVEGPCIEVRLLEPENPIKTPLMQEYGVFQLKEPVTLKGEPSTIFARVWGNSSWGKIYWELEDADGEIWFSAGTNGYGCNVYDWPNKAGFGFDGWKTLAFPISKESPVMVYSPGENEWQWQHAGNGDHQITYPVKLKGFAISLPRKSLVLREMQDVVPFIRIQSISAGHFE